MLQQLSLSITLLEINLELQAPIINVLLSPQYPMNSMLEIVSSDHHKEMCNLRMINVVLQRESEL